MKDRRLLRFNWTVGAFLRRSDESERKTLQLSPGLTEGPQFNAEGSESNLMMFNVSEYISSCSGKSLFYTLTLSSLQTGKLITKSDMGGLTESNGNKRALWERK